MRPIIVHQRDRERYGSLRRKERRNGVLLPCGVVIGQYNCAEAGTAAEHVNTGFIVTLKGVLPRVIRCIRAGIE